MKKTINVKKVLKHIALFGISLCFLPLFEWYYVISFYLLVEVALTLLKSIDERISILEFMALLAIFQWLIGACLFSIFIPEDTMLGRFASMPIGTDQYFSYAIPGTIAFIIGLYSFRTTKEHTSLIILKAKNMAVRRKDHPLFLFSLGMFFDFFSSYIPTSLAMFMNVLASMTYVAVVYIIFKGKKEFNFFNLLIIFVLIIYLITRSIREAMFGELIFIVILIGLFIIPSYKLTLRKKISIFLFSAIMVFSVQLIKPILRGWEFSETSGPLTYNIVRLNQGSLVSHVMYAVPDKIPYARGQTVLSAIFGSFIPRLVWSDKPKVGRDLVEKYTELTLGPTTSMGLTPLGETYANFGKKGGIIFMFVLGLVFRGVFNGILFLAQKNISLFYWMPVMFLHAIKVETDIARTLGYCIRTFIIITLISLVFKYLLKVRI